jgi:TonB family protein
MYFDFEDYRPEEPSFISPISRREGVLLSIIVHLAFALAIVLVPQIPFIKAAAERQAAEAEAQRLALLERQRQNARFVFVTPRIDTPAPKPPPPRADLSDQDRVARAPERAKEPTNLEPFARGNTPEREIADVARLPAPRPEAAVPPAGAPREPASGTNGGSTLPRAPSTEGPAAAEREGNAGRRRGLSGPIAEALANLQRYTEGTQTFGNPSGGGGEFGPQIQFDTKGVEFGPWVRRFVAQVRRNWFIPYAAMSLRGHVVITFNVHKDGRITDLTVLKPSAIDAFTNAAFNALLSSNPTQPLPPEYPDDKAFFTVTFYYNEVPQ